MERPWDDDIFSPHVTTSHIFTSHDDVDTSPVHSRTSMKILARPGPLEKQILPASAVPFAPFRPVTLTTSQILFLSHDDVDTSPVHVKSRTGKEKRPRPRPRQDPSTSRAAENPSTSRPAPPARSRTKFYAVGISVGRVARAVGVLLHPLFPPLLLLLPHRFMLILPHSDLSH